MKRFYLKFRIALMTLALGLASVCFFNNYREVFVDLPTTQSGKTIILSNKVEDVYLETIYSQMKKGDFEAIAHGCGNGYSTAYVSYNRKRFGDSVTGFNSYAEAKKAFDTEISEAKNTVQPLMPAVRDGEKVSRIILANENNGKDYVLILWIANKARSYRQISAPDLETALEFEQYLLKR